MYLFRRSECNWLAGLRIEKALWLGLSQRRPPHWSHPRPFLIGPQAHSCSFLIGPQAHSCYFLIGPQAHSCSFLIGPQAPFLLFSYWSTGPFLLFSYWSTGPYLLFLLLVQKLLPGLRLRKKNEDHKKCVLELEVNLMCKSASVLRVYCSYWCQASESVKQWVCQAVSLSSSESVKQGVCQASESVKQWVCQAVSLSSSESVKRWVCQASESVKQWVCQASESVKQWVCQALSLSSSESVKQVSLSSNWVCHANESGSMSLLGMRTHVLQIRS
jgi:hypothetical protein